MKLHSVLTVFFITGSVGLVVLIISTNQPATQDIRSKASEPLSVVVPTVLPAPKTVLSSPYLRLVPLTKQAIKGQPFKVAVVAKDEKNPIAEAKVSLQYDALHVSLSEKDIENTSIFPVMNVERLQEGTLEFSLFNTTEESGYEPIVLDKETVIAYLTFTPRTSTVVSRISLVGSGDTNMSSGLFIPRGQDGTLGKNILKSVEGADITIE